MLKTTHSLFAYILFLFSIDNKILQMKFLTLTAIAAAVVAVSATPAGHLE